MCIYIYIYIYILYICLKSTTHSCSIENLTEFDCFVFSFRYLADYLTREQLLYTVDKQAVNDVTQACGSMLSKFTKMYTSDLSNATYRVDKDALDRLTKDSPGEVCGEQTTSSTEPLAKAESIYPCILGMLGSAFGFIKVGLYTKCDCVNSRSVGHYIPPVL